MTRNPTAMIRRSLAGAAVSMISGVLLASYVVAGMLPPDPAPPTLVRTGAKPVPAFADDLPMPDYDAPSGYSYD